MSNFKFDITPMMNPSYQLCKISGFIDIHSSMELEHISQEVVKQKTQFLVFDFSDLEYINSQGMGTLLALESKLDRAGGALVIVGAKERVQEVFELTGINQAIAMYQDLETAMNNIPKFK